MRRWKYTGEDYRRCAEEGLTLAEASRKLGVSPQAVYDAALRYQLKFARKDKRGGLRKRSTEADGEGSQGRERSDAENVGQYTVDGTASKPRAVH